MDVRMPMLDGVAAAAELAARSPVCRVVMLTTFDDEDYVVRALRAFTRPNVRLPPAWVGMPPRRAGDHRLLGGYSMTFSLRPDAASRSGYEPVYEVNCSVTQQHAGRNGMARQSSPGS